MGWIRSVLVGLALLPGVAVSPGLADGAEDESIRLFDGQTLDGWVTQAGQPVTQGWKVEDGVLLREGRGGNILYEREVGDFDLSFEWKIAKGGNSGLKYRVRKYGGQWLGCEYQLLGETRPSFTKGSTGSLYALYEPGAEKQMNPPGEWNSARIVVQGARIEHWMNGRKIVQADLGSAEWAKRLRQSKFAPHADFARNPTGRIMLTDHGSPVWYRNLVLKPLPQQEIPPLAKLPPPNVLLILADDLGYSDLGCYGGEIATPQLDRLAQNGLRFTQFYNTARCWPTRASLLTGYYAQQVRRDTVPGVPSGGRGQRPGWAPLLPELLRPAGYRSYHSGKWHLDGMPLENGFDRSYYLRDQGRFFSPRVHFEDDRQLPPVKPDAGYYGTTAIAEHAVRCLKEHQEQHADQPFFHYLAFTAPHFPLHALPEDLARYRDTYRRDWAEVRQERYERQKRMGIVSDPLSAVETDIGPPYDFPDALETLGPGEVNRPREWQQLTDEQREFQATKMALHAAMIDRLDRELGRVLEQLRAMDAWDNTLILFLSDNGASAEIMVRDDGHDPQAEPGSAASYLCLGPGWSTVANTPFRRHKTWVHEGGIATPLIVHWPAGIDAAGQLRRQPGHVIDIVPTILELAGLSRPETWRDHPVPPPPGVSLLPALAGGAPLPRDALWWLHEGNRALRMGNWKLVADRSDPWELYDLSQDRAETQNLADQQPQRVQQMAAAWQQRTEQFQQLAREGLEGSETEQGKAP